MLSFLGIHLTVDLLVTGGIRGLTVGLLAVVLVLVWRVSRVVTIAHAQIGTFGAAVLARLVVDQHLSYWLALPLVLLVGAALGALVEVLIARRLERQSAVVLLVATIGVADLLLVAEILLPDLRHPGAPYPTPLSTQVRLPHEYLGSAGLMVLLVIPAVVVALAIVLRRTPTGLAVTASAQNPDAAELAGVDRRRTTALVWGGAGALAVLATVLALPLDGLTAGASAGVTGSVTGPGLLVDALAAALLGGLSSLPLALLGGLLVGLLRAVGLSSDRPDLTPLLVFGLLVVLLTVRWLRERGASGAPEGVRLTSAPPARLTGGWATALAVTAGVAAAVVPFTGVSAGGLGQLTAVLTLALVALSLTVLTGWAGQLSLGQLALYGVAAFLTARLEAAGAPFWVAVLVAVLLTVVGSTLLALPTLLVPGVLLGVATLGFAVVCEQWLFHQHWLAGDGTLLVDRPAGFRSGTAYYLLCLAVVALTAFAITRLRSTSVALAIIGARDNPRRAAALGISPVRARLIAFALSGGLAGLGGALFAGQNRAVSAEDFPALLSLGAVALVAVGGFSSPVGALLGTAVVAGIPAAFSGSVTVTVLVSGVGLVAALLVLPGGLVSLGQRQRPEAELLALPEVVLAPRTKPLGPPPRLELLGVTVAYGGRHVLDAVDLRVLPGEVLGVIGPNGAGKSSLLAVASGQLRPATGRVVLDGQDISGVAPHLRPRLGLGQVLQDSRLFADLTVRETVVLASRSGTTSHRRPPEDVIEALGLQRYADTTASRLSTGTRRAVELACLSAQGARLLLLDEPTAGLAQREAEAFGGYLRRLRDDLDATVVVVEHDIPLLASVCDRLHCLAAGSTLAVGPPEEVLADEQVIAQLLGFDDRAVLRSGRR